MFPRCRRGHLFSWWMTPLPSPTVRTAPLRRWLVKLFVNNVHCCGLLEISVRYFVDPFSDSEQWCLLEAKNVRCGVFGGCQTKRWCCGLWVIFSSFRAISLWEIHERTGRTARHQLLRDFKSRRGGGAFSVRPKAEPLHLLECVRQSPIWRGRCCRELHLLFSGASKLTWIPLPTHCAAWHGAGGGDHMTGAWRTDRRGLHAAKRTCFPLCD